MAKKHLLKTRVSLLSTVSASLMVSVSTVALWTTFGLLLVAAVGFAVAPKMMVYMAVVPVGEALTATPRATGTAPYTPPPIPAKYLEGDSFKEVQQGPWNLRVVSGVDTAGVHLSGTGGDTSVKFFQTAYRPAGSAAWMTAHQFAGPITKTIDQGGGSYGYVPMELYIVSLFYLTPATPYEVRIEFVDAAGTVLRTITQPFTTRPEVPAFTAARTLTVDPAGGAGRYTTIQAAINAATAGTEIVVNPGTYYETLSFPTSGTPGQWIKLTANGNVQIDGSDTAASAGMSSGWESYTDAECTLNCTNLWRKRIGTNYWGIWMNGYYLFRHVDVTGGTSARGDFLNSLSGFHYCAESVDSGAVDNSVVSEGYYTDGINLYLRLEPGKVPTAQSFTVSRYPLGLDIRSHDWIWVEGFTVQYFGSTQFGTGSVQILNGNYNIIRNNKILRNKHGVRVVWENTDSAKADTTLEALADEGGAFNRVEGNEISSNLRLEHEYYCKTKKGAAFAPLDIAGTVGNVARKNTIYRSGENALQVQWTSTMSQLLGCSTANEIVPCPFVAYLLTDTDISGNTVYDNVEAMEADGGQVVNTRIVGNTFRNIEVSTFSMQPGQYGPTWFIRNIISKPASTPYTRGGEVFKFRGENTYKYAYLYHNSIWLDHYGVYVRAYSVKNRFQKWRYVFRNNSFYTKGSYVANFDSAATYYEKPDMNYNSYASGAATVRVNVDGTTYTTIDGLRAQGLEANGDFWAPGYTDPANGDFRLLTSSGNIDKGIYIPGINDGFGGSAPDIGAIEVGAVVPPPPPPPGCTENWTCTDWSTCASDTQTRTCTDRNTCGTFVGKPAESQSCNLEITVDNGGEGFTTEGVWKVSTASGFYGQNSLNSFTAGDKATWNTTALIPNSEYDVYFRWTEHENRAKNALYEIYDGASRLDQKTIDQSSEGSGGQWRWQGAYPFTASTGKVVMIAGTSGNSSNADAVRFTLKPKPLVAFQRGNADGSLGSIVNLNDAMFTLQFLFAGGSVPACMDAADADDTGFVDLSDAVFTLFFLFQGGLEPPAPGPFAAGPDPTADAIGCDAPPNNI